MMGLLEENGPCLVAPDSASTSPNPWSWNAEVNMLYLDQPVQVGFSYDEVTNCTVRPRRGDEDEETGLPEDRDYEIVPTNFTDGGVPPEVNVTHRVGTFSSQDPAHTANSTRVAAHALWHFAQTWFSEFPHYKPEDDRVSLWAESYGGHYGPAFFRFFEEQNDKITSGTGDEKHAHYIHLDTLGIVNGLIDMVVQAEAWIEFAYNNTYGIEIFNQSLHDALLHSWSRPGGCRDQYLACRAALRDRDRDLYLPHLAGQPADPGPRHNVTESCSRLQEDCEDKVIPVYFQQRRGFYDIAHPLADPFPPPYMYGYLSQSSTLTALGVPVNFTASSSVVEESFRTTYDMAVGGFLEAIGYLLDRGVKVHMMYGDRDFGSPWPGGESASLAVPWEQASTFAGAGYAPLLVAGAGVAGMTRQVGRFSFTRVFQAGHEVPSYQPEAAYEIFRRATLGLDVPTGLTVVDDGYATEGPGSTWHIKNVPPEMPKPRCYILKPGSCLPEVWDRFVAGAAVVKDYFVVEADEEEAGEGLSSLGDVESIQKPLVS
jgi:carboxypeptidase C (cathepsin A)